MEQSLVEYVEFVNKTVQKYQKSVDLIDHQANEVTPHIINTALANYSHINIMLIAEYNRKKAELRQVEMDYEEWWDEKFSLTRQEMQNNIESKSVKVGLKEVEVEVRYQNRTQYKEWQAKLFQAEQKVSFYRRLLDMWKRVDGILTVISYNMRTELKSLSLEDRVNMQVYTENIKSRKPVA